MKKNISKLFLLLILANGAFAQSNATNATTISIVLTNATNATTTSSIVFTNTLDLAQFLVSTSGGGGGGGGGGGVGLGAVPASAVILSQETASIDTTAGATIVVEGAVVSIPAGAFSGSVTVTITMVAFSAGTSVSVGVARSAVMRFRVSGGQALQPVTITFVILSKRRQQLAAGNKLVMNWLNKKTNSWTPICAPSSFDPVTGEFSTETPPEVFNDPAFNPTSDCAPDLLGPCDGSGGEFTVFEMPESSTCNSSSGRLSDGAIAGIVIGVVAGLALIAIGAWWFTAQNAKKEKKDQTVLSSLVLGQESAKTSRAANVETHPVLPAPSAAPFFGGAPLVLPPPLFGDSPPVMVPHFFGGSPPVMGGTLYPVTPIQSYPVAGAPLLF